VDPKGKWIELTGSDEERKKQLQALQAAVGKQAGQYLYDNAVTTTDASGNKVTNHYVGIRDNGPDGKGPSFGSINAAANKVGGSSVIPKRRDNRVGYSRVGRPDRLY